ncbi:MAG TPA: MBG domain-containing protein [Mucilaginibacter sp.]
MAAKLLLRNLLTVIKKFALPQGLSRNLAFDSNQQALDQCDSYYIAEARCPGQLPRSEKRFNLFSVKSMIVIAVFAIAGLTLTDKAAAQTRVTSISVGSQGGTAITYGTAGTGTYSISLSKSGFGTGSDQISINSSTGWNGGAAPTGVTVAFNPTSPYNPNGVSTVALTITTTTATPAGSYSFTVTNVDANGGGTRTSNGTLLVGKKTVTITGLTAGNKPYDGTNSATISGTPTLNGVLAGDASNATLSGTGVGTFSSANVGTGKTVTITGYTLSGSAAGNYNLTNPTTTANITQAPLTLTATGPVAKPYGTALTTGTSTTNFTATGTVNGETVTSITLTPTGTGISATAAAGSTYTETPSAPTGTGGFTASNYSISPVAYNGTVAQKPLTITATNQNKPYGTALTNPTTSSTGFSSSGLVGTESIGSVTFNYSAGYNSTDVAGTTGIITPSAAAGGTFTPGNYSITYNNGTLTVAAVNLTVVGLTGVGKIYDGTNTASALNVTGTAALSSGVVSGDDVSLSTGTLTYAFSSINVGSTFVNVSGYSLTGAQASNYTLTQPTPLATTITGAPLTLTATGPTKIYGTAIPTGTSTTNFTATGMVNGQTVTSVTLTPDANGASTTVAAGSAYTVTPSAPTGGNGFLASNYSITPVVYNGTVAQKALIVTGVTTSNKVYDGTTTATVTGGTLSGVINGDQVTFNPSGTFATANVGTGIAITSTSTISNTGAGNYILTQPTLTARNITIISLNITGLTANNKVYDGTMSATISGTPVLNGVIPAEVGQVTLVTGSVTSVFTSATVGNGKTVNVNGYSITQPASNYTLVQPTALTANITQDTLTISNPVANNKPFDGTTAATISGTLFGVIGTDVVNLVGTGTFATSSVGNNIPVTSTSTLNGASAGNYTLKQPTGLAANITGGIDENGTLNTFTAFVGSASTPQSFTVGGQGLTASILVTPPAGYEVSTSGPNSGYTSSVTLGSGESTVPYTTIWMRLKSSDAIGTYSGNIALSSIGQSTVNVAVTGSVTGGITVSPTFLAFSTASNTNSASQAVTVSATGLTGNITVTAPTSFAVSTDNTNFSNSVTLTQSGGVVNTTVYFRLSSTFTRSNYSGTATFASTGVTTVNVSLVGTVSRVTVIPALLNAFSTIQGTPSAPQSISVTTSSNGTITVTAPTGFQVSNTSGGTYGASANQTFSGTALTFWIELAGTNAGTFGGSTAGNYVTVAESGQTTVNVGVNGTVTAPLITETGTLTAFSSIVGAPSGSQSFVVSATGLTAGVVITPPAGFEVSSDNSNFQSTITLPQSGGSLVQTPVYVRLSASNPIGPYSGNIALSSTGLTNVNVAASGTVSAGFSTSGVISALSTAQGTPSASGSFTVSGGGLTDVVNISAPSGFEVSSDNSNFGAAASLTPVSGSLLAVPVYVRLAAADAAGAYSGTIALSSTGVSGANVSASGSVIGPIVETDALTTFNSNYGTPSSSQPINVSDAYLVSGILVTAPAGFEVSTDNTTFSNTVTVGSSGLLSSTTVYARVSASPASSTPSGNIVLSTTGTSSVNVAVSGNVSAGLQEIGTPTAFNSTQGSPSAAQTITISGIGLTGDVFVAAPIGFELSTDNINYLGTLDIPAPGGSISSTVYIRLAAADPAAPYSGNIAITSTGVSGINVAVSGTVLGSQTISFPTTNNIVYQPTYSAGGTASSGLTVSYSSSNTAVATVVNGNIHPVAVGTTTITATQAGNSSYAAATPVAQTLTITPMPVTVDTSSVTITTKTYNQLTAATSTGTLGNLLLDTTQTFAAVINGDQVVVNNRTNPSGVFSNANAGTGKIVTLTSPVLAGAQSGNYKLIIKMHGTINPATVFINPAAGVNKVYDGTTAATITGTLNGKIAGDDVTVNLTGVFATASVGNTKAITSTSTLSGASAGNYAIQQPTGLTANITQAPLTITANNQSKQYGQTFTFAGTEFTFVNVNNTANPGALYASDNITGVTFTSAGSAANAGVAGSPYSIVPSAAAGSGISNYNITYVNGSLTISTIPLTITANVVKNYGTALTNGDPSTGFTSSGLANGETIGNVSMAYTQGAAANDPVSGSPYVNAATPSSATGGTFTASNYTITYNVGNVVIKPDTLTVTATGPSKIYGQALSAGTDANDFTYSATVNGETITSVTMTPDANGLSSTVAAGSPYVVTPSLATGNGGFLESNYSVNYVPFNGTVGKDTLNITAKDATKVYGTTQTFAGTEFNITGLQNGEGIASVTLTSDGTPASAPVGAYAIVPSAAVAASGTDLNNYFIVYNNGNDQVGKDTLNITARDATKVYGTTQAFAGTEFNITGLQNSDSVASVTLNSDGTPASAPVGAYAIVPSAAVAASGTDLNNYFIVYHNGTDAVGKDTLSITAYNKTKIYGTSQPLAGTEFSAVGLKNGDNIGTVTLTTAAIPATAPAGNYPIIPSNPVALGATDLSNYIIFYHNGNYSVTPATLTITADNQSIFFGDPIPSPLTAKDSGFVNNDSVSSLTTKPTISTTAVNGSPVGSYPIQVTGAVDSNYTITFVDGTLTIKAVPITFNNIPNQVYGTPDFAPVASSAAAITFSSSNTSVATIVSGQIHIKSVGTTMIIANNGSTTVSQPLTVTPAELTVTADNKSKNYGDILPAFTVSYSGFKNSDNSSNLTSQPTANTTATQSSPVGSYPITASGAADSNYTFKYVAGTLTVNKAAITVTAVDKTKVYGAANPALTVLYSGFVNGDTPASLTPQASVSTSATALSPIGTYTLTPSGAVDSNYTFSYVPGTLTITPASLTITANNLTKAYGAGIPPFTFSYSGFMNGDNAGNLTHPPVGATTATANSPVGAYPITVNAAVDSNYSISYVPGTLTVNQANLVITPNSISKVYGAAIPTLTANYSGLVGNDTPDSLNVQPVLSTTATASSPIGTYLISASGASDPNYNITYNTGNLTVTPATLTVTADDQTKTYGTANPTLTISYSGFVNGDTKASLTTKAKAATTATTTSPAGSYPITVSGAVDPNYTFNYVSGTLTVSPAVLTVTANDQSKIYGANNPGLTVSYSGFVNGDTKSNLTTQATASTTATAASPVGTYPITPAGATSNNYTFNYVNGTLTVNPATLTIVANTLAKVYGAALPTLTVAYSGFVNGDTPQGLLGQPVITTTATSSSPVGNYPINVSNAYSPNYNINYLPGTLIITQVALFISADDQTMSAGTAIPPFTATYSGFVNGDTQASLTTLPTMSTTATSSSPAGTYPITISGAVDPNYSIAYANGTLTVINTPLTFAAIPAQTYGAGDFDPGASSGSSITYTSNNPGVAIISNGKIHIVGAGTSVITATAGSASLTQTLIVNPAPLTIIANGVTKSYGVALTGGAGSAGTFFPLGLVNGETIGSVTINYGSGSAANAAVGTYNGSVAVSGATGGTFNANNYTINYVSNNIIVQPVALTITANNQSKKYGAINPGLSLSYSGFVAGDSPSNLTTQAVATTVANTGSPIGTYPIIVSGAADANYTISYVNGTLTVGKASLLITADDKTKSYGSVNPSLTLSYSGFVNGEDKASLTTQPTPSTTANINSPVGNYTISVSGAADTNYNISYVAGNLSITPVTLTISADSKTKTYGDANPPLTISYSGFVNGDGQGSLSSIPTASTSATTSSGVGSYPITVSVAVDANYNFVYNSGTLTVTPAALTITANNQTKTQGSVNPPLTLSYSGYVNGDTQTALYTPPTVTTTATTSSPVGSYPITVGGADADNYTISYVQGTLTVTGTPLAFGPIAPKTYGAGDFSANASSSNSISYNSSNTAVATVSSTGNIHIVGVGSTTITANDGVTSIPQQLNVAAAALSITASTVNKTYGTTLTSPASSAAFTSSGLVNGETIGSVTMTYGSGSAANASVGTYSGSVTPSAPTGGTFNANNYAITYQTGNIVVGATALTIKANDANKTYGATLTSPASSTAFTSTGLANGETIGSVTVAYGTGSAANAAVGTYSGSVTPSLATGGTFTATNYAITYQTGNIVVGTAALSIKANDVTKAQGTTLTGGAGSTAFTPTGLANSETIGSVTIAYGTGAASNAAPGTYTGSVTPSLATGGTFTASNYAITYQTGNIIVTANNTLTFNTIPTKVYGAADFSPGATTTTGSITYTSGNTAVATIVSGNIHIVGAGSSIITASNGTSSLQQTLTVNAAQLNITANVVNKAYGVALNNGSSTAFTSTGLVNGQTIGSVTMTYGTGSAATAAVGTYTGTVTPSAATGGTFNANNYAITYHTNNIVVGRAALSITANVVNKTYGATLTGAAGSTAFTSTGLANGQTIGSVTMAYGTGSAATAAVGTYTGTATPSAATGGTFTASNYTITYNTANIVVGRAPVTITAANKTKTQGSANPALTVTYSGFVNGQTNTVLTTQPTVTTTAVTNSPAGTYPITASGAVAANYSFTYVQGTLTVTGGAGTLTFNAIPSKVYGAANFSPGATGTGTITYTSSNTAVATIVSGNIHIVGVGTSTITASNGTTSLQQTLTVTPAPLSITASNNGKTYGTTISTWVGATFFTSSGLVNNETIGSVTITYGTGAAATAAAGSYAGSIVPSAATGGTFKAANYTITYVAGTLTVNKAVLTITAANKSKTQGTANPALTVTFSGFVNGQTNSVLTTQPTVTTTATISSPAGNYPITASGAAAANYSFTYVQGTLTITNPSNASIISVNNPEHVTYVPVDEPVVRQAVSPNGDGINDVLHIDNIESYPDNKVMLMNRNGTTIYEMTGYDNTNKVFDGHSNITKEMQLPGTYFYMIEYKVLGETKRKTGYFIIKY